MVETYAHQQVSVQRYVETRVPDTARQVRNRAETERRLIAAVETLLVQGGFGAVTPSTVARQAGVDKMLIYRYFGDLEGLMRAVIGQPGFFPGLSELCGGDPAALRALPAGERARALLVRQVQVMMASPVALELMVWEMVERNALTAISEAAREETGLRIIAELFPEFPPRQVAAITALLGSALTYLLLRRRKIRVYDGLDLHADETWALLVDTAAAMVNVALPVD